MRSLTAARENPLGARPIRPDVGAAHATGGADGLILDVGDEQFIWPAIDVIRHDVEMSAAVIRAADQDIPHACRTYFGR